MDNKTLLSCLTRLKQLHKMVSFIIGITKKDKFHVQCNGSNEPGDSSASVFFSGFRSMKRLGTLLPPRAEQNAIIRPGH